MSLKNFKFPFIPYISFLIGPWLLFGLGFLSNAIVMGVNDGQMPVLVPGGCSNAPDLGVGDDIIHSCMTHSSHLKVLSDWIVIRGLGVASPGDFLEWTCEAVGVIALIIWITLIIKDHNE